MKRSTFFSCAGLTSIQQSESLGSQSVDPELLKAAIDVFRNHCNLTMGLEILGPTSLLQRHLRLGYTKARILIGELERLQVVSPLRICDAQHFRTFLMS